MYGDIWKGLLYVGKISNFINTGTQDIVYKVGDIGPAGGIVFSVEASGLHGLESQKTDYSNGLKFNWQYAMNISNIYGSDWRLPTISELHSMYQKQSVIGGFPILDMTNIYTFYRSSALLQNNEYWSSTGCMASNSCYEYIDFTNGLEFPFGINDQNLYKVRSVHSF